MKRVRVSRVLSAVFFFIAAISFADQVDDLINQIKDPDPLVQCQAIEQLGQLKDKRAVDPLIALLSASPVSVLKMTAPGQSQSPAAADPATEKVEKAKRACAGGDKHTGPSVSANSATLKQLIAKMRTSQSFMDKAQAAEDLGKTKDKRAVDSLLAMLKEEDFGQLHSKIIIALGEIGDPKAVPVLLNLLEAKNAFTSKEAAKSLAQIGDPRAAEPLYRAMTTDPFLRTEGAEALAQLGGTDAVKFLNKAAQSEDVFVKQEAQKALNSLGTDHGLKPLADLLKDNDPKVRAMAARTLTDIGDSTVEFDLQEALTGLDEQTRNNIQQKPAQNQTYQATAVYNSAFEANVRVAAIEALGQIADPKAVRPLLAVLQDKDEAVCKTAGRALAAYKSKTVIRPIEMTLNNRDKTVIVQAIKDLGWIGSDYAVELIGKYINDPFVNRNAIEVLGNTGNPKAIPYLEQAMQSVHTEDEAIDAIIQINHPDSLKLLLKGLSSKSFVTRQKVVEAIGQFNDPSIIEPLIDLFKKNDHSVQDKVIEVLKKYEDPRINSAFADCLTDPFQKEKLLVILKERNWQPQTIREKVLYYMACEDWNKCAQLGPEGADLLLGELKNKCSSGAAKALNTMGDVRAYPVMLDCVKKWQGSKELLAGAEKTGWKPQTPEEQLIVASLTQDKAALKKLWNDPQGKDAYMNALNSENMSAVTSVMHLSIGMGLEEMISPMISRLHSLKDETMAINVANIFLSSGNQTLYSGAENWATTKGYEIQKFGFSAGTRWGKW